MKRYIKVLTILLFLIPVGLFSKDDEKELKESGISEQITISPEDIEEFKTRTKQKVEEFQQHIIIIGNKEEPPDMRNLAEREALKLFVKGAIMEISSLKEDGTVDIVSRPIEKYLARLKALPFTKVVIKFYDIAYVTDFVRGPDGRYYSTATIIQEFNGFSGDNLVYSDVTKKEIEIIIDLVEDRFFNERRWKIFLGDIRATETRSTQSQS